MYDAIFKYCYMIPISRGVASMKQTTKILVVMLVGIFLASSFVAMAHGNNMVKITTGFDSRLLSGKNIGVPDQNTRIDISIALKIRNEQQLDNYLAQVEDMNSPMFHKFLTKDQFVQFYSPSNYEFNLVYNYFKSQWSDISVGSYNLAIFLNNVPLWKAEQIFNVKFAMFKSNNPYFKGYYFAPLSPVQLPYNIAQYIKGVSGLTNAYNYHINVKLQKNIEPGFINSNGAQLIGGADLQKAYQVVQLYNGSATAASSSTHYFPTGYTIATILWEGTSSSGAQVAPFNPTDVQTYFNNVLPAWESQIVGTISVTGKGTSGTVAPGSSASNDANGVNVENTLDLEMAGTLAPGASLVCVYGPGGSGGGPSETNFPDPEYSIAAGLTNLIAVSNSWGGR